MTEEKRNTQDKDGIQSLLVLLDGLFEGWESNTQHSDKEREGYEQSQSAYDRLRPLFENAPELKELAKQYRSDCETRIEGLKDVQALDKSDDSPHFEDIQNQIDHWQATIKQIDNALEGN